MTNKRIIYDSSFSRDSGLVIGPRAMSSRFSTFVAIEDIAKTPTWLRLNNIIGRGTPLTFINVAHYKVESDKARRLAWIAEASGNVTLVDSVPFYGTIANLYLPLRYVSRNILGYQHHYAFSSGHAEIHNGRIVSAHDYKLNASKLSPHCQFARNPLGSSRVIECKYSDEELSAYMDYRNVLFDTKTTSQPIITGLADLMHGTDTRKKSVIDNTPNDGVVIVNLESYAATYRSYGIAAGTYSKRPDVSRASALVFAEPPIVYTHRRIQIESTAPPGATIIDITGNSKVDAFLFGRIMEERNNISLFCDELINASLSN